MCDRNSKRLEKVSRSMNAIFSKIISFSNKMKGKVFYWPGMKKHRREEISMIPNMTGFQAQLDFALILSINI
jgi:hypothetical protein